MPDLTPGELAAVFDFLELKRDTKLGCWLCGGNDWAARKIRQVESEEPGPEIATLYVQLVCRNCKYVANFTDRVLRGP
jgi:hypothetical protein